MCGQIHRIKYGEAFIRYHSFRGGDCQTLVPLSHLRVLRMGHTPDIAWAQSEGWWLKEVEYVMGDKPYQHQFVTQGYELCHRRTLIHHPPTPSMDMAWTYLPLHYWMTGYEYRISYFET